MKRKINILILIYILFVGCASKLSVDIKEDQKQSELIKNETLQINKSNDFSKNESYENNLNQLIEFEHISKEIKDIKDRIKFYKYITVYFYEKTTQLKDEYSKKNLFLDIYADDKRIQQKYVKKISKGKNIYNNKSLGRLDLSNQSVVDRKIVKLFFSEAQYKRDEYIKTYKLLQLKHKDINNNITELKISGPDVIYYLDNNEFIIDYKVPVEKSKYIQKETYTDSNENKIYDIAEVFTDCDNELSICEDNCEWEESYGNGKYDEGEPYYDKNLNGVYDTAEIYDDINKNGIYDYDPLNDKNILSNYKSIANIIENPIERINFYKSVSEILSVKTKGIEKSFKFELNTMKNILRFYEDQMGYEHFSLDIKPPIKKIIYYGSLKISEDSSNVNIFYNQTKKMMMQYIKLGSFFKNKLQEYNKVLKILEKDYEHRRSNFEIFDYISIIDSYEYTSKYLSDSIRYNIDLLLNNKVDQTIYKISKDKCNISNETDKFMQGFYYRALGEAISLYIDDLERQYLDLSIVYLNTFENYERKLGYNSTLTFLSEKPSNNYNYKTYLLEIENYNSIYEKYYDQIDSLKGKYIDLKEFYDIREKEYNDYLRILKYDDARSKSIDQLTNIKSDSLLLNGIYTSPYYTNEMLYDEELLLKYRKLAKEINDPILKAEFYRNVTETFYIAINQNIQKFKDKQSLYRQQIKEYENKLGKSYRKVRKRFPRYNEKYEPIQITHGTVKMRLHEMQARVMEKQYKKISKRVDKYYYNKYTDYLTYLDSISLDKNNQFKDKQNQMIVSLLAQEKKSKKSIIKSKFYKNEINFLQDIPVVDKRDFKRNYIEVGWDRYSNVSEIIWYNKQDVIKRKEYIYNKFNDLIKTVETQNNNLINLTVYKLESRGEKFLDYLFDVDLNFSEIDIEQKFNNIDELYKFDDDSKVKIIWNDKLNASEITWYDKEGVEVKRNIYNKYNDLIETIEGDDVLNNSVDIDLSLAQIKFGDKKYFENYKNEIYLNRKSIFDKMHSKSLSGQVAGILDVNYDMNGNKLNAIWYIGSREEKIKEIIFPSEISLEQ